MDDGKAPGKEKQLHAFPGLVDEVVEHDGRTNLPSLGRTGESGEWLFPLPPWRADG